MSIWEQLVTYVSQNGWYIWEEFYRHFLMAAYGVLFAAILSIPIGILIAKYGRISGWVLSLGSIIQTIPVLGFMAITMVIMGLGTTTVITTVFFYSLLPIIQNTYVGIRGVDKSVIEAAFASGMTKYQLLTKVEFPLAISVIMAGIRTALVISIGVVAVGTFVGAGAWRHYYPRYERNRRSSHHLSWSDSNRANGNRRRLDFRQNRKTVKSSQSIIKLKLMGCPIRSSF